MSNNPAAPAAPKLISRTWKLPPDMVADLDAIQDGRPQSWHVRRALRAYLDALAVDGVSPGPTRLA